MRLTKIVYGICFLSLLIFYPFFATETEGAGYPGLKFENCDEAKTESIKIAYKKLTYAIDNSPAIEEGRRNKLKEKFQGAVTIECRTSVSPMCVETCASAVRNSDRIFLCPGAFDPSGCGCLEAVLLHEAVHATGVSGELLPLNCEKSVFPDCAVTPPREPGCTCK